MSSFLFLEKERNRKGNWRKGEWYPERRARPNAATAVVAVSQDNDQISGVFRFPYHLHVATSPHASAAFGGKHQSRFEADHAAAA